MQRAAAPVLLGLLWASPALAEPGFSLHADVAAATPVGDAKSEQFGWGGTGTVSPELVLHEVVGLELSVGAVILSDGTGSDPEGVAPTAMGGAALVTAGPRVRPLATLAERRSVLDLDGFWIAGDVGAAITGGAIRPAIKASLGWDALSDVLAAGPFVGFVQVIEPDASSLRPEDARIAMFGLHGTLLPATRRSSSAAEAQDVAVEKVTSPEAAPPPDRDHDGVISIVDACPDEPETINGILDDDGCPDTEDLHVAGRFIVLDERIHFSSGTSDINPGSRSVVSNLAAFLAQHPEYAVIHIGGHADDRGAEDFNLKLSEARARVVRDLLVREGIEPARLTVDAWGESKPLAKGRSERAHAENRRVELEILERAEVSK